MSQYQNLSSKVKAKHSVDSVHEEMCGFWRSNTAASVADELVKRFESEGIHWVIIAVLKRNCCATTDSEHFRCVSRNSLKLLDLFCIHTYLTSNC